MAAMKKKMAPPMKPAKKAPMSKPAPAAGKKSSSGGFDMHDSMAAHSDPYKKC